MKSQHTSSPTGDTKTKAGATAQYLERRLRYFEEASGMILEALELIRSGGGDRQTVGAMDSVMPILDEAEENIAGLIPFRSTSFYLVNEDTNEFEHTRTRPHDRADVMVEEIESMIDRGVFAWALRENRPVVVSSSSKECRFVLQALATRSRVRGMFVGCLEQADAPVSDIHLSLVSLFLLATAHSLESFHLYRMLRTQADFLNE